MEESLGAQYALQVAVQTLKERCQQFQQRLTTVEEENIALRIKCNQTPDSIDNSLHEVDILKQRIAQLTEQKAQLANNVLMVATENRHLWARLSKLTQVNQTLGLKLNKIHDKLTQHNTNSNVPSATHSPLIRSQTFTQEDLNVKLPHKNLVDENDKISLDLEDISLKLISTIAKEKSELELQCSQMMEIQSSDALISNSIGFAYPNDSVQDTFVEEVDQHVADLKHIKESLLVDKEKLQKTLNNISILNSNFKCKNCTFQKDNVTKSVQTSQNNVSDKRREDAEIARELESLTNWGTPDHSNHFDDNTDLVAVLKTTAIQKEQTESDKICPMCSKIFDQFVKFKDFQAHVENHFVIDGDGATNFDMLP